jgi:hypothetical protein
MASTRGSWTYFVEQTLVTTSNPNCVPSIILLGALLVPVAYSMDCLPTWSVSVLRASAALAI